METKGEKREVKHAYLVSLKLTICLFASTLIGNPVSQALLDHLGPKALVAFLALLLGTGLSVGLTLRWLSHGRRWVLKQRI